MDPTGAVVANSNIEALQLETNAKREVVTNESCDFEISDLQRGTYRLTPRAPGFKTWVADEIVLEASHVRRINPTFEVGAMGTEVTVRAGAAVVSDGYRQNPGSGGYVETLRQSLGRRYGHTRPQLVHHHGANGVADKWCLEFAVGGT